MAVNAKQAMPDGGKLTVSASNVRLADGEVASLPSGAYLKIVFSDSGVGIPEADLIKVFDPYFTTKPDGSGLGLASAYSAIHNHGGDVSIESVLNQGTTITTLLPAIAEAGV
jgi:signal transduction histidine kinase